MIDCLIALLFYVISIAFCKNCGLILFFGCEILLRFDCGCCWYLLLRYA